VILLREGGRPPNGAPPNRAPKIEKASTTGRIRCPRCNYSPRAKDRWQCSCRHVWNTFDTRGVCPQCGWVWKDTQCLRCHRWSPHEDWYERAE
jgi:hypothetical protein